MTNHPPRSQQDTTCLSLILDNTHYVLAKNKSHFLLIQADSGKEENIPTMLLSKKVESLDAWKKQGFSVRGIPFQNLGCVIFKGHETILEIELLIGRKWLHFDLSHPYEESILNGFFPTHLVIRQFITKEDIARTRKIQQWPVIGGYILVFLSLFGFLCIKEADFLWCGLCIALQLVCLILPIWNPLLFCLSDHPKGTPSPPGNLLYPAAMCGIMLAYRLTSFPLKSSDFLQILAVTSIVALPLSILLIKRTLSCRRTFWIQFFLSWISTVFYGIGTVGHILSLFA